jgi:hypothetical protein
MISSVNTHGPKVKPIKNQPKVHQPHHNQHQSNNTQGNPINIPVPPKNENTAIGLVGLSNSIPKDTELSEKNMSTEDLSDSNLTEFTTEPRKRNKRGGRGRHQDHGAQRPSNGNIAPLGESNVN